MAGARTHGWHEAPALLQQAPGFRSDGLLGAAYYTDAITDAIEAFVYEKITYERRIVDDRVSPA